MNDISKVSTRELVEELTKRNINADSEFLSNYKLSLLEDRINKLESASKSDRAFANFASCFLSVATLILIIVTNFLR